MTNFDRIRRLQLLREAEGYLDLLTALSDRWPLTPAIRDRVAQRALTTLAGLEPVGCRRAAALYLQGQALRVMERYCEAIVPLDEAAQLEPENVHIWLALGWCHKRCGRLDLAIESLESALSADQTQAIIFYNLACYWSLAGNVKLAVRYLEGALEIDPDYRDLIHCEEDFDPIRNHPNFQAVVSVIV